MYAFGNHYDLQKELSILNLHISQQSNRYLEINMGFSYNLVSLHSFSSFENWTSILILRMEYICKIINFCVVVKKKGVITQNSKCSFLSYKGSWSSLFDTWSSESKWIIGKYEFHKWPFFFLVIFFVLGNLNVKGPLKMRALVTCIVKDELSWHIIKVKCHKLKN